MSLGGDSSLGTETSISTFIDLSVHMQTTAPIMILKEAKVIHQHFFKNINLVFIIVNNGKSGFKSELLYWIKGPTS